MTEVVIAVPSLPQLVVSAGLLGDTLSGWFGQFVFEPLFAFDGKAFSSQVLSGWDCTGRCLRMVIAAEKRFSNGEQITSADVIASLHRAVEGNPFLRACVEHVREIDGRTIEIYSTKPTSSLMLVLCGRNIIVFSRKEFETSGVMCGSGGYVVSFKSSDEIVLERSEVRGIRNDSRVQRMRFVVTTDQEIFLNFLSNGNQIHDCRFVRKCLGADFIDNVLDDMAYQRWEVPSSTYEVLLLNSQRHGLDILANRKALAHAFRQKPMHSLFSDGAVAVQSLFPRSGMNDGCRFLEGGGAWGVKVYQNSPSQVALQSDLDWLFADQGSVRMEAVLCPREDFISDLRTSDFDLAYVTLSPAVPHPFFLFSLFHSQAPDNFFTVRDLELDKKIEKCLDSEVFNCHSWESLESYLLDQAFFVPLSTRKMVFRIPPGYSYPCSLSQNYEGFDISLLRKR